jgi:class 3 adenylate cyclase
VNVRDPPLILAVDDTPENLEILKLRLESKGYVVETAADGEEGLTRVRELMPDLILLDIMMPKRDGISVVKELKQDAALRAIPVILVTAKADTRDLVEGLDAGGDDYLTKPFEHAALMARVRSMLRQKALNDTVAAQAATLREQASELAALNTNLEARVVAQVDEIARVSRLRRFLPQQVVDLVIASSEPDKVLESHRCDVTVVFCDLRGFTAFAETAEPEEVMKVLGEYHAALGELIVKYEGTLERFVGDGLLVIFNDPLPCPDHGARGVRMALAMHDRVNELATSWGRRGHQLGFGIGIAQGHATLGGVGFDQRLDYAVIGTVPNLASRLCDEAKAGEILISQRVLASLDGKVEVTDVAELTLKGFQRPVPTFRVLGWRDG